MESAVTEAEALAADLERLRAFDKPSHDRLLATVAALQSDGLLPMPDQSILFSAKPDLPALLGQAADSLVYEQPAIGLGATAQVRIIRDKLQSALRHT